MDRLVKANPDIYGAVVKLLREEHATKHDTILPDTRLREDLSLDGDDAVAFLDAVCERWGLDWSRFEFRRHFLGEAEISSPFEWLARRLIPSRGKKVPITVAHVVSVIEQGCWREPGAG